MADPETFDIEILNLLYGGDALGRLPDGRAVFVPYAIPGERVRVRLTEAPLQQATVRALKLAARMDGPVPHARSRSRSEQMDEVRWLAARELGKRALRSGPAGAPPLRCQCAADVAEWARSRLRGLSHEEIWLMGLAAAGRVLLTRQLAKGGLHGCALTPREVLAPALSAGCRAFVLIHNHPSGDCTPSPEDLHMTESLRRASQLVGLELLDHVIVSDGAHSSLLELGHLPR